MKHIIYIVILLLISFKVSAHSFDGEYECRISDWSPFKSKVTIRNFNKIYDDRDRIKTYEAEAYLDGVRLKEKFSRYLIEETSDTREFITIEHQTRYTKGKEGVLYDRFEDKFSEKEGESTKNVYRYCKKVR